MIPVSQSSLSTANLQLQVVITSPAGYNPSGDTVQFAFMPDTYPASVPGSGDWHTGSWSVLPGPQYWAQCLVGPANGGVVLAQGLWQVWLKVTDSPEVPVIQQVSLMITP
jgi:hypothetical protein